MNRKLVLLLLSLWTGLMIFLWALISFTAYSRLFFYLVSIPLILIYLFGFLFILYKFRFPEPQKIRGRGSWMFYRRDSLAIFYVFVWAVLLLLVALPLILSFSKKGLLSDGKIRITFLQINDVYEIVALDEGNTGGLARVAHLRKELSDENPGSFITLLAGDFLSPSAIGTLSDSLSGDIGGLQMVDVLNEAGIDLVTFGNHEFDLKRKQLQKCIDRSAFSWVSSNTFDSLSPTYRRNSMKSEAGHSDPIPTCTVREFSDRDGTHARVGFFGLTIRSGAGGYTGYDDYKSAAAHAIANLEGKCEFIVAITHLSLSLDKQLAADFPQIKMIIGGHEHVNSYNIVGSTPIAKADANVKTVYVHTLEFDKTSGKVSISSRLVSIDKNIAEDPATRKIVDRWNGKADSILVHEKFSPCHIVASLPRPFNGTEDSIRYVPTELTLSVANAMLEATKNKATVAAIFNSGSIRIDDILKADVTEYDVFRVMPYPGEIWVASLPGHLLNSLLNISDTSKGDGCFLQHNGSFTRENGKWFINKIEIQPDTTYRVAMNDYLLKGKQDRMRFLGGREKELKIDYPADTDNNRKDIRRAIMEYLSKKFPPGAQTKQNLIVPCYR